MTKRNWTPVDKDRFACHRCAGIVLLTEIHQFSLNLAVTHIQKGHVGPPDLSCEKCRPLEVSGLVAVCNACFPSCVDLAIAKAAEQAAAAVELSA